MAVPTSLNQSRSVLAACLAVTTVLLLFAVASGALFAAPTPVDHPGAPVTFVANSTQQWAFGGSASSNFSCSSLSCLGSNLTANTTFSLSWKFFIEWVVIYTQTNVSPTQTQYGAQAALNISAVYSFSECTNTTPGGPCTTTSAAISLAGTETASGYTNVTNGTVYLTSGTGSPGNVPARSIMNAASYEGINVGGSYSAASPNFTGSASFSFGASESSGINFPSPLGIVPINPVPGNVWNSSAAYTASGSFSDGYSVTANGITVHNSSSGSVAPSGTLNVSGTDLGSFTLWDNYTTPHTSVTAQEIQLVFSSGNFSGSDGWILVPTDLYGGVLSGISLGSVVGGPMPALAAQPGTTNLTSSSSESAYYRAGPGFVGGVEAGNTSIPGEPGSPSVNLQAGPEPVALAQKQYSAITAVPAGPAGISLLLVLAVVVVLGLVAGVGLLLHKRSVRHRQPPASGVPPTGTIPSPPTGPGMP